MRRLQALKERIQQELDNESRLRIDESTKEPTIPLSLAVDYAQPAHHGVPSSQSPAKRAKPTRPGGSAKSPSGPGAVPGGGPASEGQRAIAAAREKIAGMKLDKFQQRELEAELDRQSSETAKLKSHNTRLREIIALRQQSNQRRESTMQTEIARLAQLCDEACIDVSDMPRTMDHLRSMNQQIQDGAEHLKASIEAQAQAERMQLVRSYRVKIREVKQMLAEQQQRNMEGAQNWIERHTVLERDRTKADEALKQLQVRNEHLMVQNSELDVMLKHQAEQRDGLTTRIAVVKRENKRLQEHIQAMEQQLERCEKPDNPTSPDRRATGSVRSAGTRATQYTQSSKLKLTSAMATAVERREAKNEARWNERGGAAAGTAAQHQALLKELRRALEHIRSSLRQVRSAHVELLQERTELEVFMRQCMEDVRRDMYRFTVVSNTGKARGNGTERVLENYSTDERRQLLSILQSKLRVFAGLHTHMFPTKVDPLHDDDFDAAHGDGPEGLSHADERALNEALQLNDGSRAAALARGGLPLGGGGQQHAAMDQAVTDLWRRWKSWTSDAAASA